MILLPSHSERKRESEGETEGKGEGGRAGGNDINVRHGGKGGRGELARD